MILVNNEQVTLDELSKKLGVEIPIEKILKKPVFEINPAHRKADPANGPFAMRVRSGIDFPAHFRYRVPKGATIHIRYCTSRNPNPDTEGRTEIFHPRNLAFNDEAEFIGDDEEKAVFYYLHFFCNSSPLRRPTDAFEYDFVDDDKRATARIESITKKREALVYADTLEGDALMIVAKALRIPGVHHMEEKMVKAEILERAMSDPGNFLSKAQSQVAQIEGLIIDGIDKGIFKIKQEYGVKRWLWNAGPLSGSTIVEMPENISDETQALISQIQAKIQEYLPVLINVSKTVNAKANAAKELEGVDILSHFQPKKDVYGAAQPIVKGETIIETTDLMNHNGSQEVEQVAVYKGGIDPNEPPFPTNFDTCKPWVFLKTGKKTIPWVAALNNAIAAKQVTPENIDQWFELESYIKE